MTGRKLFREYAQENHKKEAKEFVRIENEWCNQDTLITKKEKSESYLNCIYIK